MRPKRLSIGDLRDKCEVYEVTTDSRDAYGNLVTSLSLVSTQFLNVTSKMKSRDMAEGGIQYYKEFEIIGRPGAFESGNQIIFGSDKISVVAIESANTAMIKGKGQSVTG